MKRFVTLLLAITFLPQFVQGRDRFDFYINETVFLRPGAEARVDDKPVDISKVPFPATIEKRDGEWLWLEKAWVQKKHIMNAREAVEYYTEQTKKTPNDAALWRNLGVAWQHARCENQNEFALKSFTEALRLDPNDALTYRFRADIWTHQQKYDEAIKDFDEAIRLNPKDPENYADRGMSRVWNRQIADAIDDFTAAIERDPSNASYYEHRGSWRRDVGDLDGLLNDFQQIIQLCESGHADKERYKFAYQITSKIRSTWPEERYRNGQQAVQLAEIAYEISSRDTKPRGFEEPNVIEAVAFAAAEVGDFDKAIKWTRLALKWMQKEPNNDEGSQEWQDSKSDLTSCIEQFGNHKPYRSAEDCEDIARGLATAKSDKYRNGKRAVELATMACELTNWKRPKFLETFAAACAEIGEFAKAIEWQQKAIELYETIDSKNHGKQTPGTTPNYYSPTEDAKEQLEAYKKNQPRRSH